MMLFTSVRNASHQQDATLNSSFDHTCNAVNQMRMDVMEIFYILFEMQAIITDVYITEGTSGSFCCHA
jgi:hypothetical protein